MQVNKSVFVVEWYIFDNLFTVIMNFVSFCSATRTFVLFSFKLSENMNFLIVSFNFFDNKVLQSDKIFCRISVEHISNLRFWFLDNSILTDLVQICSTFFDLFYVGSICYPNIYYRAFFFYR